MRGHRDGVGEPSTLAKIHASRRQREKSLNRVALGFYGGGVSGLLLVVLTERTNSTAWQIVATLWIFVVFGLIASGLQSAKEETHELAQYEKDDENRRRYVLKALAGEHYVLWLRDFGPEGAVAHSGPGGSVLYTHQDPAEESIVRDIRRLIPTLAIANTEYTDPDPAADRVWVNSPQWPKIVEGYARHASAVVLCAQRITEGLRTELDMLASTGLLDRTWLVLSSNARSQLASESPAILQSARWVTRLASRTHPPLNPIARTLWNLDQRRSGEITDPTPEAFLAYLRELPKRPARRVIVEINANLLINIAEVLEQKLSRIPAANNTNGMVVLNVESQQK